MPPPPQRGPSGARLITLPDGAVIEDPIELRQIEQTWEAIKTAEEIFKKHGIQ